MARGVASGGRKIDIVRRAVAEQPYDCVKIPGPRRAQIDRGGKQSYASRVAWELAYGDPGDQWVLHLCPSDDDGVNRCVNPRHLYLGTHRQNADDMRADGSSRRARRRTAKLSYNDIDEIRRRFEPGKPGVRGSGNAQALADEFGVSKHSIWKSVNGTLTVNIADGTDACP